MSMLNLKETLLGFFNWVSLKNFSENSREELTGEEAFVHSAEYNNIILSDKIKAAFNLGRATLYLDLGMQVFKANELFMK